MQRKMIFHHPLPVFDNGKSGSQVRPYQMVKAFQNIGYEVELVSGYGEERKVAMKKIMNDFSMGHKFDFIYSESSTMPTLLTEIHHLPLYPYLDFKFFSWAHKKNISIGLFYRDIHWRFDAYKKSVSWYKRAIAVPFYWFDLFAYQKQLDYLFLPSSPMKEFLPINLSETKIVILPPGGQLINMEYSAKREKKNVLLVYVGGIQPPVYDLIPMFKSIKFLSNLANFDLKICCRSEEWHSTKDYYKKYLEENIQISHHFGHALKDFYRDADIFLMLWEKHQYQQFAMPVKVIESLSYGVPILTLSGTEAARFIQSEDIGWVVNTIDDANYLLLSLIKNRKEIEAKRFNLEKVILRHTWEKRAELVAKTLTKLRGNK